MSTLVDLQAGRRGHKLLTKELIGKLPGLYSTENVPLEDKIAVVKFFSPYNGWRWYACELSPETGIFYGLVEGFEREWGYFSFDELASVVVLGIVPAVERDLYFKPTRIGDLSE